MRIIRIAGYQWNPRGEPEEKWHDSKPRPKKNRHTEPKVKPPEPAEEMAIQLDDDHFIQAAQKLYRQIQKNDVNPALEAYIRRPFDYDPNATITFHVLQRHYQRDDLKAISKADLDRTEKEAKAYLADPIKRSQTFSRVKAILANSSHSERLGLPQIVKRILDNADGPQMFVTDGEWVTTIVKDGDQHAITIYPLRFFFGYDYRKVASSGWDILVAAKAPTATFNLKDWLRRTS